MAIEVIAARRRFDWAARDDAARPEIHNLFRRASIQHW